jgi:hypothetical protein
MISTKGSVHSARVQSVEMTDCATYLDEAAYRNVSFALVAQRG